jgi:maleylacetoacetate isomerase
MEQWFMDLTLYNYFRSSPSYRVRIALQLKGLRYNYKAVHLLNNGGEQNSAEYQKINPAKEVPSLVHNGKTLTQSFAIIEYLDDCFPDPKLFPVNKFDKALVKQFCETIN